MKGHLKAVGLKRRFLFVGLPLAVGALIAVAVIATGPVSAAPTKGAPPGQGTTIYSDTFTPFMRLPDYDALQHVRYVEGPGSAPNAFIYNTGSGHDAYFNTPDLTLGATPMSAVSAEVCLQFTNTSGNAYANIVFGVQDKDRNVTYAVTQLTTTDEAQQCRKLTFDNPVQLLNHPHLVLVLDLKLKTSDDTAFVDGVTYTLRPTQTGDVTPGSSPAPANLPSWPSH
jgi:hypothetical protein